MSGVNYLDGDTIDLPHQFLRDGGTLDDLAGRLYFGDTELRAVLQLPTAKPIPAVADEFDLWRVPEMEAQL